MAGTSGQQKKGQPTPQLSCELCRERKVKCDKGEPCSNCASSGVTCVPIHRMRLPRGRHGHHSRRQSSPPQTVGQEQASTAVDERIRRLEALLDHMGSTTTKTDPASTEQVVKTPDAQSITSALARTTALNTAGSNGTKRQSLSVQRPEHFWEDLVGQIHGLHSVIELAPGEAHEDSTQAPDPMQIDSADGGVRLLGLTGSGNVTPVPRNFIPGRVNLSGDKMATSQLCQIYLKQVDPVIKILHRPSLEKLMLQGQGYLEYPDEHMSVEALRSAVCYSAANSMTESQCQSTFYTSKSSAVADCRSACEAAIERSGLLATQDITVLQAFVLYLVARRSEDRSRAVWTLITVAVRIAKALCIYQDPEKEANETFFDQQMRKRLWLTICLMDLQASFGQASQPLIGFDEAAPSLTQLRHINDSDFDLSTKNQIPDREGLTDTTFALVTYHAQLGGRLLNFATQDEKDPVSGKAVPSPKNNLSDMEARQLQARHFELKALSLLHFCDPESSPQAWFTWHGTQCLVAGTRLAALRPIQRLNPGNHEPPPLRTEGDTELLRITLHTLEKVQLMHTDPRGEAFRWYVTMPWHALAIAIAECYVCTDEALLRHAWPLIEASYQHHESVIGKYYKGGALRGPLAKLMGQTREKLAPLLNTGPSHSVSETGTGDKSFGLVRDLSATVLPSLQQTPNVLNEGLTDSPPPWLRDLSSGNSATIPSSASSTNTTNFSSASSTNISSSAGSEFEFGPTLPVSTPMIQQQQAWNPTSILLDSGGSTQNVLAPPSTGHGAPQEALDQSWRMWEEFVSGISPGEFTNPEMFFFENNLGVY